MREDMARLLFTLLMICVFTPSLLQTTLADIVSVRPGENITLSCNITNYSEISWYRLESEKMKLLISAKKGKLGTHFSPSFSVDDNHFEVTEESSLAIIGVNTTDLGLYYCGGQNKAHIQFGEAITLKFPEHNNQGPVASFAYLDRHQIINIILTCVCSISFLINIICVCLFRARLQGKSAASSHTCCSDTNTAISAEKEMNLHYATFAHRKAPADENTCEMDRVTYAGVRRLPA